MNKKYASVVLATSLAFGAVAPSLVAETTRVEAASVVNGGVSKVVKLGLGKEALYLNNISTKAAKKAINAQLEKVGSASKNMKINGVPGLSFIWNSGLQNAKAFYNISANLFLYHLNKSDDGRGVIIYLQWGIPYSSKSQ